MEEEINYNQIENTLHQLRNDMAHLETALRELTTAFYAIDKHGDTVANQKRELANLNLKMAEKIQENTELKIQIMELKDRCR